MGAAVAFELARELRRRELPLPRMLIASGARAPQFRRGHVPPPAPSDGEFLEELRRLEGIPAELLNDAAAMRAILPALRADAALYRNYVYTGEPPLDVPIRAYGGAGDPRIGPEHLQAWAEQTTASFRRANLPRRPLLLERLRSGAGGPRRGPAMIRIWRIDAVSKQVAHAAMHRHSGESDRPGPRPRTSPARQTLPVLFPPHQIQSFANQGESTGRSNVGRRSGCRH